ncbi:MAG: OadG family protein [Spirochaetota bacterium]
MLLIDGLTLTVVGMVAVFAFLGVLVVSMALLKIVVDRLPPPRGTGATGAARPGAHQRGAGRLGGHRGDSARAAAAAAVAAYHAHKERSAP